MQRVSDRLGVVVRKTVAEACPRIHSLFVEPRHQLPDRKHGRRRSTLTVKALRDGSQFGQVHVGVLVLAEHVLKILEATYEPLARLVREKPGKALEQIADLLGVLAKIMDLLRRGVGVDQPPALDKRRIGSRDSLRDERTEPARRVLPVLRARNGVGIMEPGSPLVECLAGLGRGHGSPERVLRDTAAIFEHQPHRLERARRFCAELLCVLRPFEKLYITVASGPGETAE